MKILFTRFPLESRYGGAEVQTLSLMKGLSERGHEVVFVGSCPTLLERTKELGIRTKEMNIGPPPVTKWGAISFLWKQLGMKKKLIECCRGVACYAPTQQRSAILMLSLSEKLLLTDWAVAQGIKVIWIEHDRVGRWLRSNPWLPKLRSLSQKVTTVVVSDLSRDIYMEMGWFSENIVSIPNGIDIEKMKNVQCTMYNEKTFRIGCISRLSHDKGIDLLIDAVSEIENVSLTIVGNGPEENNLRQQMKEKITDQNSKIVDFIPDITEFYNSIDVLLLPSREHDPFGLVVAEAMATGIPTIVSDACGITRHLEENEALIVPAGDTEAFKRAILDVQKQEVWSKISERGRQAAQEKFSLKRMVNDYEKLMIG